MSAELLRKAATILRERAEAADFLREPWAIWPDLTEGGFVHIGNAGGVIPEGETSVAGEHNPVAKVYVQEFAAYIATMHPGVGLALADWLDWTANDFDIWGEHDRTLPVPLLTIARLIVGEE